MSDNLWDGKDRREDDGRDHDMLLEIRNDVKHMVKWAEKHEFENNDRFKKIDKDAEFFRKIIYGCVGVIFFVELVLNVFKYVGVPS